MTRLDRLAAAGLLAVAAALSSSPAFALDAAGEGRRLWLKMNCYGCHGMHAQGAIARALRQRSLSAFFIQNALDNGPNGMPVYRGRLSPTDVDNLAAYLKSTGKPSEPTFNRWWQANPKG